MLRRSVDVALGLFAVCSLLTNAGRAEDGPVFKHVIPTDAPQFARAFSADSRVGAMIFDNLFIDTEIGRGTLPSVRTKQFSYVLQPKSDKEVSVVQNIRGFVSTQGSGNAVLLINANGKPSTVDWKKAIQDAKVPPSPRFKELEKTARKEASELGFTDDRPAKFDDFFVEIKSPVPIGKPLQTTLVLLVDRLTGDDGSGAMIVIDSIDFEVLPEKK